MSETPAFGIPWAADGESRPSRFRTPLAWVAGVGDGVVLVDTGEGGLGLRRWLTMAEWDAWVAEVKAAPFVAPAPDEQPWLKDDE